MSGYLNEFVNLANNTDRVIELSRIINPNECLYIRHSLFGLNFMDNMFSLAGDLIYTSMNTERSTSGLGVPIIYEMLPKVHAEYFIPEGYFQGTAVTIKQTTGAAQNHYFVGRSQKAYPLRFAARFSWISTAPADVIDRKLVKVPNGFVGTVRLRAYLNSGGAGNYTFKARNTLASGGTIDVTLATGNAFPANVDVSSLVVGIPEFRITTTTISEAIIILELLHDISF